MRAETVALVRHLAGAFPSVNLQPETVAVYAQRLDKIPVAELAHVVDRAIDRCKFFPSLAEMLEIRESLRSARISSSDRDASEQRAERERALSKPPPELQALIDGVARSMTPDRRLLS